jgi:hypothetical protein
MSPTYVRRGPPQISKCLFSDDGSSLYIHFDSPTDQGNLRRSHACEELFEFRGVANALCVWINHSSVVVYPTGNGLQEMSSPLIEVGDTISLRSNKLRARCPSLASPLECARWYTSDGVFCPLDAPWMPLAPLLSLSAPTVLSSCQSYLLDLSTSSGSGGRAWEHVIINVTSVSQSDYSMQHLISVAEFYEGVYDVYRPIALPGGLLLGNETYIVSVLLCNFLQQCDTGSTNVRIVDEITLPVAAITGSAVRRIIRAQRLVLRVAAYVGTCNGTNRASDMTFQWSVFDINNQELFEHSLVSRDPSKLVLMEYQFDVGVTYAVTVVVTDLVS